LAAGAFTNQAEASFLTTAWAYVVSNRNRGKTKGVGGWGCPQGRVKFPIGCRSLCQSNRNLPLIVEEHCIQQLCHNRGCYMTTLAECVKVISQQRQTSPLTQDLRSYVSVDKANWSSNFQLGHTLIQRPLYRAPHDTGHPETCLSPGPSGNIAKTS